MTEAHFVVLEDRGVLAVSGPDRRSFLQGLVSNDTDKVATYGIAALVAGGIAAKAGFFKLLWVGILAFKKLIILGFIALAGYSKKLIAWIRGRNVLPEPATGSDAPKT